MKAKNKRHEDDGFYCHMLCSRRAKIREGEDIDNHRLSSSFVFHRNNEGQHKKRNKDNGFLLSSSCLRGARVGRGGEDDDD
jgi:hypothetical protein